MSVAQAIAFSIGSATGEPYEELTLFLNVLLCMDNAAIFPFKLSILEIASSEKLYPVSSDSFI